MLDFASDGPDAMAQGDDEPLLRRLQVLQDSEARYEALCTDLEQRVRAQAAEIEECQRRLFRAERLASLGQLAASVGREISGPTRFVRGNLVVMQGYLDRLQQFADRVTHQSPAVLAETWRVSDLDFVMADFPELLAECIDGCDGVIRIVREIADLSGGREEEELADLNEQLRTVCKLVARQLPPGVRFTQTLRPLPRLMCMAGDLAQALTNILLNAAQAVREEGEIRVESEHANGVIRVRITDTGCGISPDLLPWVFDPFLTTADAGQSIGLGLTVARDIVQAHHGRIEAESAPGAGSTFTIVLPV
jgi:signal transduction histidine kinase